MTSDGQGTVSLLSRVLEHAPIVVFAVDRDGIFTVAAGRALDGTDGARGEHLGRSIHELYADVPPVSQCIARALAGESFTAEIALRETVWEVNYAPTRGEGGEVDGVVGIGVDITPRRRAEEDARRHLWFLDAVIENLPDMVFVKDAAELRFIRFNRAGEELLGYRREELIGKNDYDFFPKAQADFFTEKDRAVLELGTMVDIPDERIATKHRGERSLHTKKIPIYSEGGAPLFLLGISEDITERRRVDDERQQLLERLRDLDRLKAQLIANVSHELRTPLTLILALSERILHGEGAGRADVESIQRHARSLQKLVTDLLDLSKLEAGGMTLEYAEVDLARLVRQVASSFEVLASERGIDLAVDVEEGAAAQVDADKVSRILANLLSNALKHVGRGGRVRCTLRTLPSRRVSLKVEDDGAGVPEELRARVFDRFFQRDDDGTRVAGTGLGLAIVKEFAELHGGTASVEAAPGGGASFVVELPIRAPSGVMADESLGVRESVVASEVAAVREAFARREGSERPPVDPGDDRALVLVVEDNAELNRILVEALATEHRVETAFDGVDGLAKALALEPDLILTDAMMPRMSGDEMVRRIREVRSLHRVPIIVLTARADDELRLRMLREGAQDYVTKPFSTEEVRARVRNLVALKHTSDFLVEELQSDREDLRALTRRLSERDKQLKRALDEARIDRERAERASQMKTNFLGLVAHEVRTPLTALSLRLQALERAVGPETTDHETAERRDIRKAGVAAHKLFELVDGLLQRAEIDSGKLTVAKQPLDLRTLVRDVVEELQPTAERKRLTLDVIAPPLSPLHSDARIVRVIVANLVSNALKFTTRGGVTVRISEDDDRHRVEVLDTGPGIAAEHRAQVFQPFVQLTPIEHKHEPGLGLGLALVAELVEAVGGRIDLSSELGRGSTFVVQIPSRPQ